MVEHIIELQTIAQFIRSTITGEMRSGARFEDTVDGRIWENLAFIDYPLATPPLNRQTMPYSRMFSTLGTRRNTEPLVLAPKDLNSAKEKMWGGDNPTSPAIMKGYLRDRTAQSLQTFVNHVRRRLVVLQYLAEPNVRDPAPDTYRALRSEMALLLEEARAQRYRYPDLANMLDRWFRDHIDLMIQETRDFMNEFRTLGVAAIRGSGINNEQELVDALFTL